MKKRIHVFAYIGFLKAVGVALVEGPQPEIGSVSVVISPTNFALNEVNEGGRQSVTMVSVACNSLKSPVGWGFDSPRLHQSSFATK